MFYSNLEVVGGGRRALEPTLSTLGVLEDCVREENRALGRKLRAILAHVDAARQVAEPDEQSQDWAVESAEAEIGLVLGVTPTTATWWVRLALDLDSRLPAVLRAVETGTMTLPKARVLLEETQELDAELLAGLQHELLAKAKGRTASALRRVTRRAVLRVDADAALKRRAQAVRQRGVSLVPAPDAMAHIHAFLPAEDALAVFGLIDSLAHCAVPGDERGIDARRADALVDLIVHPEGKERVQYVVHVEQTQPQQRAMDQADEAPVFLRGYGPVPAQLLRELGIDTHPDRYVPGAKLAAAVRKRDVHCTFPACRLPAERCELDHVIPFRCGGKTVYVNITSLCKHHHRAETYRNHARTSQGDRVKHLPGWDLNLRPDGTTVWTTPSGRAYTTTPPWLADDEPPDFTET